MNGEQHIVPLDWNEGFRKQCGASEVGIIKDHVCRELGLHPKDKEKPKYISCLLLLPYVWLIPASLPVS